MVSRDWLTEALQVHFEAVPPVATLQSMIPTGTAAVFPKPFTPPPPAFRAMTSLSSNPQPEDSSASFTDHRDLPTPQSGAVASPSSSSSASAAPRQYF